MEEIDTNRAKQEELQEELGFPVHTLMCVFYEYDDKVHKGCDCICHPRQVCDIVGYSKSKAIRKKDEMHSKSTNEFVYYKCDVCDKWHVESTGAKREKATKKTNQISNIEGDS